MRSKNRCLSLGDRGYIELPDGAVVIVDAADLPWLARYEWRRNKAGYVVRRERVSGRCRSIRMHHMILPPKLGYVTDHADGNPIHNARSNLRYATSSQSNANRGMPLPTSGYRGVHATSSGRWAARIRFNKRLLRLGVFDHPLHAAVAYNIAAIRCFGQFARLNPVTITFSVRLQIA